MLPLHVLKQSGIDCRMMVDAKNGESYDGLLGGCDNFMNLKLLFGDYREKIKKDITL